MSHKNDLKQWIDVWLNHPQSLGPKILQGVITSLILFSAVDFLIHVLMTDFYNAYIYVFHVIEYLAVAVFTLEYCLKLWAAPSRLKFVFNFYSLIDLLAILPFYVGLLNFSFLRTTRIVRLARLLRLARLGKGKEVSTNQVMQENLLKNIIVIITVVFLADSVNLFFRTVPIEVIPDIMFASSILALAAMFGTFAFSYESVRTGNTDDRLFAHLVTGSLMLPIGMMFLVIQISLELLIGFGSAFLTGAIWTVYFSLILWDFSNAKRCRPSSC